MLALDPGPFPLWKTWAAEHFLSFPFQFKALGECSLPKADGGGWGAGRLGGSWLDEHGWVKGRVALFPICHSATGSEQPAQRSDLLTFTQSHFITLMLMSLHRGTGGCDCREWGGLILGVLNGSQQLLGPSPHYPDPPFGQAGSPIARTDRMWRSCDLLSSPLSPRMNDRPVKSLSEKALISRVDPPGTTSWHWHGKLLDGASLLGPQSSSSSGSGGAGAPWHKKGTAQVGDPSPRARDRGVWDRDLFPPTSCLQAGE